jgi:hypothetical protein
MAKRGKLWICNGYWKESAYNPFEGMVVCDAEWDENEDWEDKNGTYWFTCSTCGYDNEVVYDGGA